MRSLIIAFLFLTLAACGQDEGEEQKAPAVQKKPTSEVNGEQASGKDNLDSAAAVDQANADAIDEQANSIEEAASKAAALVEAEAAQYERQQRSRNKAAEP